MLLKLSDPLLRLRSINNKDEAILCQIYASTRTEELLQVTGWTTSQKEAFLRAQFTAQHTYYQNNYKGADFWLINYGAQVIGRLYLHTNYEGASMRIIDIAILPEWRNKGFGKKILAAVMELAGSINRSVTIHVERFNRAMKLYRKLGFELVSQTNGIYHLLEWKTNPQNLMANLLTNQSSTNGSYTTIYNGL